MRLIHRAGPCENLQLSGMPAHETVVLVPRELLLEYAKKMADGAAV